MFSCSLFLLIFSPWMASLPPLVLSLSLSLLWSSLLPPWSSGSLTSGSLSSGSLSSSPLIRSPSSALATGSPLEHLLQRLDSFESGKSDLVSLCLHFTNPNFSSFSLSPLLSWLDRLASPRSLSSFSSPRPLASPPADHHRGSTSSPSPPSTRLARVW